MTEDKETQPITRIDTGNGTVWYPRYHKNAEGEWELNDKSFRELLRPHMVLEKPATETDND